MGRRQKKQRKVARVEPDEKEPAGYAVWIVRQVVTDKRRQARLELLEAITPCSVPWRSATLVAEGFNREVRRERPELLAVAIPAERKSSRTTGKGPAKSKHGA